MATELVVWRVTRSVGGRKSWCRCQCVVSGRREAPPTPPSPSAPLKDSVVYCSSAVLRQAVEYTLANCPILQSHLSVRRSTLCASRPCGILVHHDALRFYYHYIYCLPVSIRNHIVTGFNPYPDETCRARHRHHPLVSNRIPEFSSSVKLPLTQVRQARCGVKFKIHAGTTPGIAPFLQLLSSPSSPCERSTFQRVRGHRLGGMFHLPTVSVVHRRSSHDVTTIPAPIPYADGRP